MNHSIAMSHRLSVRTERARTLWVGRRVHSGDIDFGEVYDVKVTNGPTVLYVMRDDGSKFITDDQCSMPAY